MQVKTIVTSVALATVLAVGPAFAQATPPPQNPPAQPVLVLVSVKTYSRLPTKTNTA